MVKHMQIPIPITIRQPEQKKSVTNMAVTMMFTVIITVMSVVLPYFIETPLTAPVVDTGKRMRVIIVSYITEHMKALAMYIRWENGLEIHIITTFQTGIR